MKLTLYNPTTASKAIVAHSDTSENKLRWIDATYPMASPTKLDAMARRAPNPLNTMNNATPTIRQKIDHIVFIRLARKGNLRMTL